MGHVNTETSNAAFWHDTFSYFDTQEFKDYAAVLERVIYAVPEVIDEETGRCDPGMITIRGIHQTLGIEPDNKLRRWTQDAIDSLKSVEPVGLLPTKYRKKLGTYPQYQTRWSKNSMAWLFARGENDSATYANLGGTA